MLAMQVLVAEHMGMCFGVRDAVDMALDLTRKGPVTILGDLVHNPDVVAEMDAAGAVRVKRPEQVQTQTVLLTAHGTSERVQLQLRQRELEIYDAVCPLVRRAHLALLKLVDEGRFPVVIGQAGHVEVRGLTDDLDEFAVVLGEEDLHQLEGRFRLGVVSQTTQPLEKVLAMVDAIRDRFPEADVRFIDTVCQPTKDRQAALRKLTAESDVVIVVGGPDSNNSRKLTELARKLGRPSYQVANAGELRREWFDGVNVVGLTAGTSTPNHVIEGVRRWLESL
jgi:4-hydroxy-3-methylbut-2-enyl diphosphate reductase